MQTNSQIAAQTKCSPCTLPRSPLLLIYIKQTRNLFKYIAQGRSTPLPSSFLLTCRPLGIASLRSNPRKIHNRYTQPLIPTHTHTHTQMRTLFLCLFPFASSSAFRSSHLFLLLLLFVLEISFHMADFEWLDEFFSFSLSFSLMNNEREAS